MPMPFHSKVKLIVAVILGSALVGLGAYALQRMDPYGENGSQLSKRFEYDLAAYKKVDAKQIAYQQTGEVSLALTQPRGICVGLENRFHVAGDAAVLSFDALGSPLATLKLSGEPTCLTVGGPEHKYPGALYVGWAGKVARLDDQGAVVTEFSEGLDEKSVLTSVAVADEDLFVADAGQRVVLRFNLGGQLVKRIGERDEARGIRGFSIPSHSFDLAVSADGLLRVVNPGGLRMETYTFDGGLLGHWGQASAEIEGFFGCCNPANFALLPDGRFVTVEKGLPRIKVYSKQGEFECVVAAPDDLAPGTIVEDARDDQRLKPFDVAVDSQGRVLVLDPNTRKVRIFERK